MRTRVWIGSVVALLDQQQTKRSGQQNGRSRGSGSSGKSGGDDRTKQGREHDMNLLESEVDAVEDDGAKPIDFEVMKCV